MRRLLVLSDLHVGPDGAYDFMDRSERLREVLRGVAAADLHLVLNGDAFDFLMFSGELDPLDPGTAVARAKELVGNPPGRALLDGVRAVLEAGGQVTFRLGNHDLELGLPQVQQVVRQALGRPERLAFDLAEITAIEVGDQRVGLAHGEHDDDWNRFPRPRLDGVQADGVEATVYPPGSQLVDGVLNPAKARGVRYADLLKPDMAGAVVAMASIDASLVGGVKARQALQMMRRRLKRGRGQIYEAIDTAEVLPELGEALDALTREDRAALEALLGGQEGFFGMDPLAPARWLRAALAPWARMQRRLVGDDGTAFFDGTPDAVEMRTAMGVAVATDAALVLLGHSHAATFGHHAGVTVVNTGTWTPLMQPPAADAPLSEWQALLDLLRADPAMHSEAAQARVQRRLTGAGVEPDPGGIRVRLLRWGDEGEPVVLQEARVPSPAHRPSAPERA